MMLSFALYGLAVLVDKISIKLLRPKSSPMVLVLPLCGDGGDTEIYAFVRVNGEEVYRANTEITVYNEWHTAAIENIEYTAGDELTVGLYVRCGGPNAWGKIDDAKLTRLE